MARIAGDSVVTIYFEFIWSSTHAGHTERYLATDVSFTRDILPLGVKSRMRGLGVGDSTEFTMDMTEVPPFKPGKILGMSRTRFVGAPDLGRKLEPRIGRFYPKYYIDNVPGTRPDSNTPFRVVGTDRSGFKADLNHPMADREVTIRATVMDIKPPSEGGGSLRRWPDIFFKGPGMQARLEETPTDFLGWEPFRREEDSGDAEYYATSGRHDLLESGAAERVRTAYAGVVEDGMTVLDLLAGRESHLPDGVTPGEVTGLGLNRADMDANPALAKQVVHNVNEHRVLPFEDGAFDAIVCTAGVEYLTSPFEIFEEAGRVLRPGGIFALAFTETWDENKVIGVWPELYPFERMGLVSQYFVRSEQFDAIRTISARGDDAPNVFCVQARRIAK